MSPGERLSAAVTEVYELAEHEAVLLTEAAATLDLCAELQRVLDDEGAMVTGDKGEPIVHPAVRELRQQRLALARLLVALRIPTEDTGTGEPRLLRRGLRGVYAPRGVA